MKMIKLNAWKMLCSLPYQADFSKHIQEGILLPDQFNWLDATVPGSVYADLEKQGIITDPLYGQNSLNCEWVANRWWVYRTIFNLTADDIKTTLKLCFKGIDYSANIYLNGHLLGHHEGMYIPFETVINDYVNVADENVLVCVLEHAPFCDPQPGYTSKTRFLKARYNYKWDFASRLVNVGIYDEVMITSHEACSIQSCFVRQQKVGNDFKVNTLLEIDSYRNCEADINIKISRKGKTLSDVTTKTDLHAGSNSAVVKTLIEKPLLWSPNGYGEQNLYDVDITITHCGIVSDMLSHRIGFKTVEYICADGREDALPYSVVVNGKRIFLKGTNIVPFNQTIGTLSYDELAKKLKVIKDCNINYLRIWGGGHIESEDFYNLCDEYGLMIMQEFTMSSSGCDDVPSQNEHFVKLLHKAALYNVKLKRNHTCLVFWSGGNELTDARYLGTDDHEGHPATFEDKTLAMLRGVIDSFCPDIMMLPASASGPNALLKVGDIGNNHDVHGPWGYQGVEAHYTMYNNSDSIVHGEFGCGGMANIESINRFMPEADKFLQTSDENQTWRHHTGGWDSYIVREMMMFGNLRSIPLVEYIKVNQFVQAESLRYALEANRRRQWKCVGEMSWQFNEPWPNIQCSNVVDYFGGKKLAYYFMRDAYASVMTSLKYDKLFYNGGEEFKAEVYIVNDNPNSDYSIECNIITTDGVVLFNNTFTGVASEDTSQLIGMISITLPADIDGGFSIVLKTACGKTISEKEYLMLIANKEMPVSLTATEQLNAAHFPNRKYANGIDSKRADYKTVLQYYDRVYGR